MQQSNLVSTKIIPSVFPDINLMSDSGFIRLPHVKFLYAISSATVWRNCAKKQMPTPKILSARVTAWNVGEIKADLLAKAGA